MGEIIAAALLLIVVVVALGGLVYYVTNLNRANQADIDSPQYRNHLGLARWVEHALADDMVRPLIPAEKQDAARKLLAEFYKEHFN